MTKPAMPTQPPKERAVLVGVEVSGNSNLLTLEDSLVELALLADTAGLSPVGEVRQRVRRPNPKTFVGSGKVEEIKIMAEENLADIILFDDELSPRHQRELEKVFGEDVRIIDRSALILDIFAQHARTREGSLQVELAQYEYLLPRLTRAWTHLARQAGGGGGRAGSIGGVGLRGPGETQLEVDRRSIRTRISTLKRELKKVRSHRRRYLDRRKKSEIPTISLVGYTNAGKTTLLNHISGSDIYVADQLFATLDPTTRRIQLPDGNEALLTDTVGFIQKLPATLVAAFRATLEEIAEADILLHVVDISHPNAVAQSKVVRETLDEIDVHGLPVVTALNKIDTLSDPHGAYDYLDEFDRAVAISALNGEGVPTLLKVLEQELQDRLSPLKVSLPYEEGRLISLFHEHGIVETIDHQDSTVLIHGRIPTKMKWEFEGFETNTKLIID